MGFSWEVVKQIFANQGVGAIQKWSWSTTFKGDISCSKPAYKVGTFKNIITIEQQKDNKSPRLKWFEYKLPLPPRKAPLTYIADHSAQFKPYSENEIRWYHEGNPLSLNARQKKESNKVHKHFQVRIVFF